MVHWEEEEEKSCFLLVCVCVRERERDVLSLCVCARQQHKSRKQRLEQELLVTHAYALTFRVYRIPGRLNTYTGGGVLKYVLMKPIKKQRGFF